MEVKFFAAFSVILHSGYTCPAQSTCNDLYGHHNCRLLPPDDQCGPVSHSPKVVGGKDATLGEFPWMALLFYTDTSNASYPSPKCGGSVITTRHVLTAAHCADPGGTLKLSHARVGEHDLGCTTGGSGDQVCAVDPKDIPINRIVMHEEFDEDKHNDIALLHLESEIDFNLYIAPICLPMDQIFQSEEYQQKTTLQVAGWGISDISKLEMTSVLQTLTLPIAPLSRCKFYYPDRRLNDNQLCVGGEEDKDSCDGDSGGPLMGLYSINQGPERYFQVGITSFGVQSCGIGAPAVYTKLPRYVRWILDNLDK